MSGFDVNAGRIDRLRQELDDEQVWLPTDPYLADAVLAELDYARHPHAHEGVAPRYGALVVADAPAVDVSRSLDLVEIGDVPLDVARRLADGRSSFVVRTLGGNDQILCFDRTHEYESSTVHLTTATGAFVVQRLGRGWVRLATPHGVATWDGLRWATEAPQRPTSSSGSRRCFQAQIRRCSPTSSSSATTGWAPEGSEQPSSGGSTVTPINWTVSGSGPRSTSRRSTSPNRSHFAPLLNALSQYDRAALDRR